MKHLAEFELLTLILFEFCLLLYLFNATFIKQFIHTETTVRGPCSISVDHLVIKATKKESVRRTQNCLFHFCGHFRDSFCVLFLSGARRVHADCGSGTELGNVLW